LSSSKGCKIIYEEKPPEINTEDSRPLVIVSCAISLDGKLASEKGDTRLSSFEDKVEVHRLRSRIDAILVGINTILADDPHLTVSEKYYKSNRHPIRVVLDSYCRIPLNAQVLTRRREVPTIIATTRKAPEDKIRKLREMGADVIVTDGEKVNIREVLTYIRRKYGVRKLMVEGGGKVIGEFFKNNLVDLVRVSITPVIFGGEKSIPLIRGVSFDTIEESPRLKLYRIELCGHNIVLHFYVEK